MIPDPLHPAVVHFPIALSILLPLAALWALWAVRRGTDLRRTWAVPIVLAGILTFSAWAAIETGEDEEDAVEEVVGEAAIHEHEERAELFLILSGTVFVVMVGGLLSGTPGKAARLVGTAGSLGLIVAGYMVGSSGGELVYEHGAASAYVDGAVETPSAPATEEGGESPEHDQP